MSERYSAIVEHCDGAADTAERLPVWAGLLRDLGVADVFGVFASLESGSGWLIRVARHDGQPLTAPPPPELRIVADPIIPRQRGANERNPS